MKISARGLQEFLAGRLSREEFQRFVASDLFEKSLSQGRTIKDVHFESSGLAGDDDYLIFEFGDDAAARRFRALDEEPEPST